VGLGFWRRGDGIERGSEGGVVGCVVSNRISSASNKTEVNDQY